MSIAAIRNTISLVAITVTLVGCAYIPAVGPDYNRQDMLASLNLEDANTATEQTNTTAWWQAFDDANGTLTAQLQLLEAQNPSYQQTIASLEQAWQQRRIAVGSLWPTLSASFTGSRNFIPLNVIAANNGFGGAGAERLFINQFEAGLSTSWQLDLFGRLRRQAESAVQGYLAQQASVQAIQQSLVAELLQRRVALASTNAQRLLAEDVQESRDRFLTVVEQRYKRGAAGVRGSDVLLAQESLGTASAAVAQLNASYQENIYQLQTLLGNQPEEEYPERAGAPALNVIPTLPEHLPEIPDNLPASLIDQRPDLRAAELRVAAATADIGVAVADLYPDLTLSGSIGFQQNEVETLFRADQLAGSIAGSIAMRLFAGGALRANIDLQEAEAKELTAAYGEQVLTALREVETALSNEKFFKQRLAALQYAADSTAKAEKILIMRYLRGDATILEVLDAQRRAADTAGTVITAQQALLNNRIALHLALGGDWRDIATTGSASTAENQHIKYARHSEQREESFHEAVQ